MPEFPSQSTWHGYAGYADGYAMVDPNKLTLVTPGIDRKTGEYLDFGVPATVVANYCESSAWFGRSAISTVFCF